MFDVFERYISAKATLTDQDLCLIRSLSVEKTIAKREFVLREGEIARYIFFITRGLLRLLRTDDKGNEYILRFATENSWLSDRESYVTGNPSNAYIDAIEDSEVLMWDKQDFHALLKEIPALKQFMKELVGRSQIANQNRVFTTISGSAEEKYFRFIENHPDTFNRVPLHMIASYLGVTRETLSRIRRHSVNK